ncbi:MAG TPA: YSC84-related protein [Gammaproteobacteria bacterium]|nr:YSC84-related protein [Gammaproteobacteria bacterium]
MQAFTKRMFAVLMSLSAATAVAQHSYDDAAVKDNELAQRRAEILKMSDAAIADLRKDGAANKLFGEAYGHAVFDTTKGGLIVTGAGGTGVAMTKSGRMPVFMHVGAGGIGLGAGVENYKLIILFENKDTYDKFVEGAWSAGFSAQAAAGDSGKGVVGKFNNGVAVYHQTDKGLIAQVDVTGVKFWPADKLNPGIG